MKKSLLISIAIHCLLLFSFLKHGGKGNGNGNASTKSSDGHFLGQEQSPVEIKSLSKSDILRLEKEHRQRIAKMKKDCGKDAYGGIGVRGLGGDTRMFVSEVGPGTPAELAGIVKDDQLDALEPMTGKPGTSVSVTIDGILSHSQNRTVIITRELICFKNNEMKIIPRE
jgi:C-terminal processing protease CtpA/Prc